ncbi:unnamed protein product, partial [Nesidiocoris tenuis]
MRFHKTEQAVRVGRPELPKLPKTSQVSDSAISGAKFIPTRAALKISRLTENRRIFTKP